MIPTSATSKRHERRRGTPLGQALLVEMVTTRRLQHDATCEHVQTDHAVLRDAVLTQIP